MITGKLSQISNQLNYLNNKRVLKAANLIGSLNFQNLQDNVYEIEGKDFYYILASYQTVDIKKRPAEAHRKYIDFQYVISGKEEIGFTDYSNIKKIRSEYINEKDAEFFDSVVNECFVTLYQNNYAIFFPEDVHRPGVYLNNANNVRKAVFKILIDKN